MRAKIQYTNKGYQLARQICKKYGIPYAMTINGWWIYEITPVMGKNRMSLEQYDKLKTAEDSGLLRRYMI